MSMVSFLSVAFGLLVLLMAKNNAWSWPKDLFMGACGIVFLLIGLFQITYILYSMINHMPLIEICEDCIRQRSIFKKKNIDLLFEDVADFKFCNNKITVIYTKSGYAKLMKEAGWLRKMLIASSVKSKGSVGNIIVSNMSIKPKEIYEILIHNFREYKEFHK